MLDFEDYQLRESGSHAGCGVSRPDQTKEVSQ
jgi:hypothetical protein